jgi:hypothetical protein
MRVSTPRGNGGRHYVRLWEATDRLSVSWIGQCTTRIGPNGLEWMSITRAADAWHQAERDGAIYLITRADDPSIPQPGETAMLGVYGTEEGYLNGDDAIVMCEYPDVQTARQAAELVKAPAYGEASVAAAVKDMRGEWLHYMPRDVLHCPADSYVGAAVIQLCKSVDQTLRDNDALEPDVYRTFIHTAVKQATVWLRG